MSWNDFTSNLDFWNIPTTRKGDGDQTLGDQFLKSLNFVPWGTFGTAEAVTGETAAQTAARTSSWWRPVVPYALGAGTVAVAGPYLGGKAGDTVEKLTEGVSEGIENLTKSLAEPVVVVGLGLLAFFWITQRRT